MTIQERFWAKVDKPTEDTCWPWTGTKTQASPGFWYGIFHGMFAHRVAYELTYGKIDSGRCIDHLCRNTLCVNPAHLEMVTFRENTRRGVSPVAKNMAKTHCVYGHAFTDENTYWVLGQYGYGRQCKECVRRHSRTYQQRKAKEPRTPNAAVPASCRHGHAMTPENQYWRGSRVSCKTCRREGTKRWQHRHPGWWRKYESPRTL